MSISINDVNRLYDLFHNGQTNYGTFTYGEIESNGKVRGEAKLVYGAPTPILFQKHCNGEQSIGLSPINSAGKCTWGAIDIDRYETCDLVFIVKAIYDFNIPLVPCFSKSKKLHLFAFFSDPVSASEVKQYLAQYINIFDYDTRTEIFPKQTEYSNTPTGTGNWINIPFFGKDRWMVGEKNEGIPLERALDTIFEKRLPLETHQNMYTSIPYSDAPPCIRKGAILRYFDEESHCRNNFLFSASVYLRMKEDEDVEGKLTELNKSFSVPIKEDRLHSTIFTSLKKKSYFYLCKDMPGCNKIECRKTEYGVESRLSTGLDYGQIEQWREDPPYYTWMVNGQKMIFYSENDIINQTKFREQAYRFLHIMPRRVKDEIWCKIINRATTEHIIHEEPSYKGGFSRGSQFLTHTYSFFNDRRKAEHPSQLKLGRTYHDVSRDVYVFSASAFLKYLREVKDFHVYSDMEIETKLKEMGAQRQSSFWVINTARIEPPVQEDIEMDFHDKEEPTDEF